MKKTLLILSLMLVTVVGCSNGEIKKEETSKKAVTMEDPRHWKLSTQSQFEDQNGSYTFLGEIGKYGLVRTKRFKVNTPHTYTWYIWENKNDYEKMIGKKVEMYGTSEMTEKELLAKSVVEKISEQDIKVPDYFSTLKFDVPLEFPIKGNWKLEAYIDEKLIGSTIIIVEDVQ